MYCNNCCNSFKRKKYIVIKTHDFLVGKGIETVDYIDVEFEEAKKLLYYDLVFIMGGNSCHLFTQINKSGADKILLKMIDENYNVVGASAGAMLLSSGNKYLKYFSNPLGIDEGMTNETDTRGLNITDHILYPHYGYRRMGNEKYNGILKKQNNYHHCSSSEYNKKC